MTDLNIPLLARKPLCEWSPSEYLEYVRSLYHKPEKPARKVRLKKVKPPFTWKLTKTGKLSVTVNRTPKWLAREELTQIGVEFGNQAEPWVYAAKKKIKLSTQEEEDRIAAELKVLESVFPG